MNLDSNIDFDLRRFFRWWGRELSFLVPEKVRQWLSDQSVYVFMSVANDTIQFNRVSDGKKQFIAELQINKNAADNYAKLKSEKIELEKARLVLRLTRGQAIARILFLPAATKENLRQVVSFEMDRYTPFKAEQVYFDVKFLGKEANGLIRVLLVLTPKETLDKLLLDISNLGVQPVMVDFEEAENDLELEPNPYDLLPEFERPVINKTTRALTWVGALATLLLIMAVLAYPVWRQSQIVESLKQQVKSLEKETRIVQSRQLEIDNIIDETERLINTKNNSSSLNELINAVSLLLPDETSLTHLQYRDAKLQIQGQSPTASALIGVLEESPLFTNARFVSPLTQDRRTGLERFQISVDVIGVEADDGK